MLSDSAKVAPVLDLYHRVWQGAPLSADDLLISADEKTSIPARRRKQPTLPPAPNPPTRVEHEYFRGGVWAHLAAWDLHRAKVFGRCESPNGIAAVDRLVDEGMNQEPYKSARRVFWIGHCSVHRGQRAADRFHAQWPMQSSSTPRPTPVGSIRSRSTSRSFSERSSPRMTLLLWPISNSASSPFRSTTGVSLQMDLHAHRSAGSPGQAQRPTLGSSSLTENTSP